MQVSHTTSAKVRHLLHFCAHKNMSSELYTRDQVDPYSFFTGPEVSSETQKAAFLKKNTWKRSDFVLFAGIFTL
jgi:hypothetical protein